MEIGSGPVIRDLVCMITLLLAFSVAFGIRSAPTICNLQLLCQSPYVHFRESLESEQRLELYCYERECVIKNKPSHVNSVLSATANCKRRIDGNIPDCDAA